MSLCTQICKHVTVIQSKVFAVGMRHWSQNGQRSKWRYDHDFFIKNCVATTNIGLAETQSSWSLKGVAPLTRSYFSRLLGSTHIRKHQTIKWHSHEVLVQSCWTVVLVYQILDHHCILAGDAVQIVLVHQVVNDLTRHLFMTPVEWCTTAVIVLHTRCGFPLLIDGIYIHESMQILWDVISCCGFCHSNANVSQQISMYHTRPPNKFSMWAQEGCNNSGITTHPSLALKSWGRHSHLSWKSKHKPARTRHLSGRKCQTWVMTHLYCRLCWIAVGKPSHGERFWQKWLDTMHRSEETQRKPCRW